MVKRDCGFSLLVVEQSSETPGLMTELLPGVARAKVTTTSITVTVSAWCWMRYDASQSMKSLELNLLIIVEDSNRIESSLSFFDIVFIDITSGTIKSTRERFKIQKMFGKKEPTKRSRSIVNSWRWTMRMPIRLAATDASQSTTSAETSILVGNLGKFSKARAAVARNSASMEHSDCLYIMMNDDPFVL
jgi:hypothetical protein